MATVAVDTSTDGDTVIPAPGDGKQIQIDSWDLTSADAVIVSLQSGSTVLWSTNATNIAGGGAGIVVPYSPSRTIVADTNTPVTIGLSDAINVLGTIDYHVNPVLS